MSQTSMDPSQPPVDDRAQPSRGTPRLIIAALLTTVALVALAVLAVTQLPQFAAADPTPEPSVTASPSTSPSPTAAPSPSESEAPSPSPSVETGELPTGPADAVMSFTPRCDVVPPVLVPATTVLEDGRVIWRTDDGQLVVRQLTSESLDDFREQVRSTGLVETSASYRLERRPGTAEPPGHGVCVWGFVWNDGDGADVELSSVMWLGDEEEATYYEPAPERETLHALAEQLMDPTSWYGDDGWVQPAAVAFEPETYLVLAAVTVPQLATQGAPDLDEVSWPFDEPPDEFGVEYGVADPPSRCDVAATDAVAALAAELADSGLEQFEAAPFFGVGVALPWAAQGAAVDFTFWPVLPDGRPPCQPAGE